MNNKRINNQKTNNQPNNQISDQLKNHLNNPNTNWQFIAIVAMLALIAVGGLFIYQSKQKDIEIPIVEIPEKIDEFADWKLFSNGNYNYSIKYPNDWSTVPSISVGQVDPDIGLHGSSLAGKLTFLQKKKSANPSEREMPSLQIEVYMVPQEIKLESIDIWKESCGKESMFVAKKIINDSEMVIGHRDSPYEEGDPYVVGHYYCAIIYHKGFLYEIVWHEGSFEDSGLFNKIISTFGFIEKDASDWKTYTNEEYGFEFGYPQNFLITADLGQYFLGQKPIIEIRSDSFNYLNNTIDAFFTVSVKSNAKAECEYIPKGSINTIQNKEINGVSFTMFFVGGAATGNTYSNTVLHHLKDTMCYEVVTTIHESSDGNTPEALPKINEQKVELESQLDKILSTFRFID